MIVRFAGFGGQGIVLSSFILGRAAVADGKKVIQNQSYGSESRGGECYGDVIISDQDIFELEPTDYDVLVAISQPAYDKFIPHLKPGGALIWDSDLVVADSDLEPAGLIKYSIAATDIAFKKYDRKIIANMVLIGYLNELIGLVSKQALASTIAKSTPEGTEELNLNAMKEGISIARSHSD